MDDDRFDNVFGNEHADQDDVNALGNERERNGRNRVNRNTILRRDDLANAEFSLVYGKDAEAHLERDENGKVIRKWIKHRSQKKLDFIDMTRINGQDEWDDTQGNAFIDVGVMDVDGQTIIGHMFGVTDDPPLEPLVLPPPQQDSDQEQADPDQEPSSSSKDEPSSSSTD